MKSCKQPKGRRKREKLQLVFIQTHIITWKIISLGRKNDTISLPGHSAAQECHVMHFLRNLLSAFFALIKEGTGFVMDFIAEASIPERSWDQSCFTMNSHHNQQINSIADVYLSRMKAPTNSSKATWELLVKHIINTSLFLMYQSKWVKL